MICFPHCKINIGLQLLHRRSDGYHEIKSLMYPVPWYDVLEIVEAKSFAFTTSGRDIPGDPADNLCCQAYDLVRKYHDIPPVHIHLLKKIPMGGGLGGGSSDGAHVLQLLNTLFDLNLTDETLMQWAAKLGSDCPFFLKKSPQIASGRGEVLQGFDLDLSGYTIVLLNDGTHVSTKSAYENVQLQGDHGDLLEAVKSDPGRWKDRIYNDFEPGIFDNHTQLRGYKQELYSYGAVYAAMTGSGATIYGIFKSKPEIPQSFKNHLPVYRELEL
ncbi:MAG: 4-(cytidine 5'-diphospho)-2-C-methyl-D-erythritol kinase [Bacteroidota bacterium]